MIYDPPTSTLFMPYKLESGTNILYLFQLLYSFFKWGLELSDSTCTGVQNSLIDSSQSSLNKQTTVAPLPFAALPQTLLYGTESVLACNTIYVSRVLPVSLFLFFWPVFISVRHILFIMLNFRWLTKPGDALAAHWIKYTLISKEIIL